MNVDSISVKIKKPAKIQHLVNWFFGNYCTTICDLSNEEWKKRKWSWKRTDCALCRGDWG